MRELLAGVREYRVVLRNVRVDRWSIVRNTVNELVLRVQDFTRDITDSRRDGGGEHECLPFRCRRQKFGYSVYFSTEAHVKQSVSFV